MLTNTIPDDSESDEDDGDNKYQVLVPLELSSRVPEIWQPRTPLALLRDVG
jgi:hypothetical protein